VHGPRPAGHWSGLDAPNCRREHQFLAAGKHYRVIRAFTDFDGALHPPGEEWTFLGCAFLPHEDGLSWFVSLDGEQEWHIPMQWHAEAQGPVIDALDTYLQDASGG